MSSPSNTTSKMLLLCQEAFPQLNFKPAASFYWSPKGQTVFYDPDQLTTSAGQWALLHEAAHGQLAHHLYQSDLELLRFELAAWETAKKLAVQFGTVIDQEHIETCLDSYRDWLYARSTCPTCQLNSLQISSRRYCCLNCHNTWDVSVSRFCRPYRMQTKKTPE